MRRFFNGPPPGRDGTAPRRQPSTARSSGDAVPAHGLLAINHMTATSGSPWFAGQVATRRRELQYSPAPWPRFGERSPASSHSGMAAAGGPKGSGFGKSTRSTAFPAG